MAFEIDLSARTARSQVRQLESALDRLGRKADQTGAKLQSSVGGMGGTRGLKNIVAAITSVNQNLLRMGDNWTRSQTQAAVAMGALNKRIRTQRVRFDSVRKSSSLYGDSLSSLTQRAAILRSGMLALGTHVGMFSAATLLAATATYGLVKALKAVVSIGAEFTRSLAHTSAIIGETRENLGRLTEQMFKLAETTKFTTTEVAEASTVLAKTGLKMAAVGQALPAVLNLAAIGSMDMARAADIAANSMFGFQLKAHDLTMVVDTLAFVATNSNTTVQQLGHALSFVAPVAAATGAKFKDVALMLGVMADSGVKASRAGTTFRRAYVNLINPSEKAVIVFRDLGISIRDGEGAMRSMVDIMKDFTREGGNIQDLEEIFGVRALPGMAAIFQDFGKEIVGVDSKYKDLNHRIGVEGVDSAERMRDAMEKNLIDTWLKFTSVLSVKATRAFLLVEDSLTSLVQSMTGWVRSNVDIEESLDRIGVHLTFWKRNIKGLVTEIQPLNDIWKAMGETASFGMRGVGIELNFLWEQFKNFPLNVKTVFKVLGEIVELSLKLMVLYFVNGFARIEWVANQFNSFFVILFKKIAVGIREVFNPLWDWIADKAASAAEALKAIGLHKFAGQMKAFSNILRSDEKAKEDAYETLEKSVKLRDAETKAIDDQIAAVNLLKQAYKNIAADNITAISDQRAMTLARRDDALAMIEQEARIRRRVRRGPARLHISDPIVDAKPGGGRGQLREDKNNIMKNSIKDMKTFIKLQKMSTKSTKEQIQTLLILREISPFEAFKSNITKAEIGIEALVGKYNSLIEVLAEFKQQAVDTGHKNEAEKFQTQIENVTLAFESQLAVFESTVTSQTNGLTLLQEKYELVSDSAHGYIVQLTRLKEMSETQLLDSLDQLRGEGTSEIDKIREAEAEKMNVIDQARATELTLQNSHHEIMLMSESEYLDRKFQIQIEAGGKATALWADTHNATFALAESIRSKDMAGALSNGIKMLDQAGKTSKKAFKLSKAAKISQAVVAMHTGATEALKWGYPMGPIFAGMIVAQGLQSIQAIRATQFGGGVSGGGGAGGSTATPAVPKVDVPVQSDALFNQTTSGGVPNTIDSSARDSALNVTFEINTVDATGISQLLENRKPQIVGMIQQAYEEQGRSGGPVQ